MVAIRGSAGADFLYGQIGNDIIYGFGGDDFIQAQFGSDRVRGGAGNDYIQLAAGDHIAYGDAGNDFMVSGTGTSKLFGGIGNDHIRDTGGNTTVYGGAGFDTIEADNAGVNVYSGGAGIDTLDLSYGWSAAVDFTMGVTGTFTMAGDTFKAFEVIIGADRADAMTGNARANIFEGGSGADRLSGMAGNDVLAGGRGADVLAGGLGADRFVFRSDDWAASGTTDRITDFDAGQGDVIDMRSVLILGYPPSLIWSSDTADGVLISVVSIGQDVDAVLLAGVHDVTAAELIATGNLLF